MAHVYVDRARMTTSTTGTGTVTLTGTVTKFLSFAAAGVANGDTVTYLIENGDAFEVGRGTYSSTGPTLARTTVYTSSNSNNLVDLAGSSTVTVTVAGTDIEGFQAELGFTPRTVLSAARTYYVRTDGSDSNTGLADTAGGAFRTKQKAIDTVAALDLSIYSVTIQVGPGTWTDGVTLKAVMGSGTVTLIGDVATPSNVTISRTGATCITANNCGPNWSVRGFKLQTVTSGALFTASGFTRVTFNSIDFGVAAGGSSQIVALAGAYILATGGYAISGNAGIHAQAEVGATIDIIARTVTLIGTPAFSVFAFARWSALFLAAGASFSGSATGSRYNSVANSVISTSGGGASFLPGNSAGTVADGGVYE